MYVGITDNDWFNYLSSIQPDEVNFWKPGTSTFTALETGAPFLFKLKSPNNHIAGGGFFYKHARIPLSLAWLSFENKNGAKSKDEFFQKILNIRRRQGNYERDPVIGCIVLTSPFFFKREDWIEAPPDWHPRIVQGKRYDMNSGLGEEIWQQVQERLRNGGASLPIQEEVPIPQRDRYGNWSLIKPRLGQGAFRLAVTDAYSRKCAVTGEKTLPVLQSAHIKPFSLGGPHDIKNGLLLRADLHILFDRGYMTVSDDYKLRVSPKIKEEFSNGRDYYTLSNRSLFTPAQEAQKPSPEFLEWHHQNVFMS